MVWESEAETQSAKQVTGLHLLLPKVGVTETEGVLIGTWQRREKSFALSTFIRYLC